MEYKTTLKIDINISRKNDVLKILTRRLQYLIDIKLLKISDIVLIALIKMRNYYIKINLNKELDANETIIYQAILGDNYKRVGINLRDYSCNVFMWNDLFSVKKCPDETYVLGTVYDVTHKIKNALKQTGAWNYK